MPSDQDRQDAQAARAAALRDNTPTDTAESVQADAEIEPVPEPAVQISATFVPEGIEVVILIPHEGINVNLPDLPNTLEAHGEG